MIRQIGLAVVALVALSLASAQAASAPGQSMIEPHAQAMPLIPFLDYLLDESLAMDIEEVAGLSQGWQPFAPDRLPRTEGNLWLRFTIAPLAPDGRPKTFLLDMGQSVPGVPILYDPTRNELSGAMEWRENLPSQRNALLLPEAGPESIPCYIRLEGLPGPYFAPMIRSPQNAASNWDSLARFGAILALAVVMLLCFTRGMSEKGQWRFWTAMFVGVALAQAILGMPYETQRFSPRDLANVLMPGLALMFLPHVGRHLMGTRTRSRVIDIQLFLLSLPGAALAILPLAPGWNWLDRWLDLWPAATLIFLPTALGAWLSRLPGSRRFLLACLLPPIFTGVSLLGMEFGQTPGIMASLPLWGVALAAILLATTRAPENAVQNGDKTDKDPGLTVQSGKTGKNKKLALDKGKNSRKEMPGLSLEPREPALKLDYSIHDPNLRILPRDEASRDDDDDGSVITEIPRSATLPSALVDTMEARENALREPVDDLLREAAALANAALPPAAKDAVSDINATARRLATILSDIDLPPEENEAPKPLKAETFNLQRVLRSAHDSVASLAERSGIALSWFMPPYLEQTYRGDGETLETVLRLLLESSARSSKHGAIKISARQAPGSHEPGHILFTVMDDGQGYPPYERSSLALARVWEFTGKYGGYLSVESSQEGATISFTAHFQPEEETEEEGVGLILLSDQMEERRKLKLVLQDMRFRVCEASGAGEARNCQKRMRAPLLIAQGGFAMPAAADIVREYFAMARKNGASDCHALAITPDDSQWPLLKASGFTHAILEPVEPEILRDTVKKLMERTQSEVGKENDAENDQAIRDITPTMLIEQNISMKTTFEGPDWLTDEEEKALTAVKDRERSAAGAPGQEPGGEISGQKTGGDNPEDAPEREHDFDKLAMRDREKAGEWKFAENLESVEWVGEPTPVPKKSERGENQKEIAKPEENGAKNGAERGDEPLMDFIVGVARKTEEPKIADSVKNFMEGGASMVARAVTDMMENGKETLKSSSDPAVLAMLENMDEITRRVNGFYASGDTKAVAAEAGRLEDVAGEFGLRDLARMASCVARAARANDIEVLDNILPDLGHKVEQTRIFIQNRQR